ncbi:hypothetical protein UFOVP119_78 [uncultured Caudovirales phage]|uniref:Uncharacterized protein n=1 Tax=uncultured Caudovirales phage TaxID=2100421 RepID=A0A6J5L7L8_9CAUD|nr:hypothetical protein UFOVP119_78 [uncultured Caudovirales phage]
MKFDRAAATADRLLSKYGASVVFTRTEQSAFNPVTQVTTAVSSTFKMNGAGFPPGKSAEFRIGSLERRNIVELRLAPKGGTLPQPGDRAAWNGSTWNIIWVGALDPAGDGAPYCVAYGER